MSKRNWTKNTASALLAMAMLASSSHAKVTLYVSISGNDNWDGLAQKRVPKTLNGPKRSLEGARNALRKLKQYNNFPADGAEVVILPGRYFLRNGFRLNPMDEGTAEYPLVYRAQTPGTVILDGGKLITVWRKPAASIKARLPEAVRDKVLQASLSSAGINRLGLIRRGAMLRPTSTMPELFCDDNRMPLAQYPNDNTYINMPTDQAPAVQSFKVGDERPKNWDWTKDIWAYGFFFDTWADGYDKVSYDKNSKIATLANPAYQGITKNGRFKFMNVLEELDTPGEWAYDVRTKSVFFLPPGGAIARRVVVSTLDDSLLRVEGASHLRFSGLTFQYARKFGAIVNSSNNVILSGCNFYNLGVDGVVFENSRKSGVDSSNFSGVGETAIKLHGGDRPSLTPGENFATNNWISACAEKVKTYRPGIEVDGVGQYVANNRIENMPMQAINVWGNNHLVEKNEIGNVVRDTNDAGAIYMGYDQTARGNVIRYNIIQDVVARVPDNEGKPRYQAFGIYLDDMCSGQTVYGNVMRRCSGGMVLGGGRNNTITNNVFEANRVDLYADARGLNEPQKYYNLWSAQFQRINPNTAPFNAYPGLAGFLDDEPLYPKYNVFTNNVFTQSANQTVTWQNVLTASTPRGSRMVNFSSNYVGENPGFMNPAANDYRLLPGANAASSGFQSIDASTSVGLQISDQRKEVPAMDGIYPYVP